MFYVTFMSMFQIFIVDFLWKMYVGENEEKKVMKWLRRNFRLIVNKEINEQHNHKYIWLYINNIGKNIHTKLWHKAAEVWL